jgi:hypothetical protein
MPQKWNGGLTTGDFLLVSLFIPVSWYRARAIMHQTSKISILNSGVLNDDSEVEADGDDYENKDNAMVPSLVASLVALLTLLSFAC